MCKPLLLATKPVLLFFVLTSFLTWSSATTDTDATITSTLTVEVTVRTTPTVTSRATSTLASRATTTNTWGTCSPRCHQDYPSGVMYRWQSLKLSTTITAATVMVIVNKDTNTTRTTTVYASLPSGVKLPPTNDAGTRTHVVTGYDKKTTAVAFPTVWEDYDSLMYWSGTLSTKGTCTTVLKSTVTLPEHSRPVESTEPTSTDPEDPVGFGWTPIPDRYYGDFNFIDRALTTESFHRYCSFTLIGPVAALYGVKFLTDTSTQTESGRTTPTSTQEPARNTAKPAQSQPQQPVQSNPPNPQPSPLGQSQQPPPSYGPNLNPNNPANPANTATAQLVDSVTVTVPQVITSKDASGGSILITSFLRTIVPAGSLITTLIPSLVTTTNAAGSTGIFTTLAPTVIPAGQASLLPSLVPSIITVTDAAGSVSVYTTLVQNSPPTGVGTKAAEGTVSPTKSNAQAGFTGAASTNNGWNWRWGIGGAILWISLKFAA